MPNDIDDATADTLEAQEGFVDGGQYRKSLVAVIGAIATLAGIYGIDVDPELVAAVTTLLTALLVWGVPNEA
jgi:hypothetical protein